MTRVKTTDGKEVNLKEWDGYGIIQTMTREFQLIAYKDITNDEFRKVVLASFDIKEKVISAYFKLNEAEESGQSTYELQ